MGKGSKRRKGDNQKQYAENWEKIFGKDKKKKEKKKYVISEKNLWLNPKDNFGKLERGKVE